MAKQTFVRKQKPALLIWGIIIFVAGLALGISALVEMIGGYPIGAILIFLACIAPGAGMIVGGVIKLKKTAEYNAAIRSDAYNYSYTTSCVHCGRTFSVKITDFIIHRRNYPEGYVDCPFCKQHVSKNAFTQVKEKSILDA